MLNKESVRNTPTYGQCEEGRTACPASGNLRGNPNIMKRTFWDRLNVGD